MSTQTGDFLERSAEASPPASAGATAWLARLGGEAPRLIVLAWLAGAVAFLVRTARRIGAAGGLLARSRPAQDHELLCAWRETVAAWPQARAAELRVSAELDAPACFGLFRRAILLPSHAQRMLEPGCLRQVLLHELIHLERRDAWAMCVTELARALFWFHPAAWWLYRQAEELRELSCDAQVVARTGRPRAYARGLVAFAERIQSFSLTAALPSWSGSKSQFSRRIEMLLQSRAQSTSVSRGAKLLVGACLALCAGAQLALASAAPQERASEPRAATPLLPKSVDAPGPASIPAPDEGAQAEETRPRSATPLAPREEKRLRELGYAQGQDPLPAPPVERADSLGRATALVERALARNPGDEDLRQAVELLRQARASRTIFARPDDARREELRRADDAAKRDRDDERAQQFKARALDERRSADQETRRREEERMRAYLDRQRDMSGAVQRNPLSARPPVQFEDELQDALRLLEQQRAELDRLRERIESLRSQVRTEQPAPDAPRQRR